MTVRHALPTAVGRTQPSSVMPVVRSSDVGVGDRHPVVDAVEAQRAAELAGRVAGRAVDRAGVAAAGGVARSWSRSSRRSPTRRRGWTGPRADRQRHGDRLGRAGAPGVVDVTVRSRVGPGRPGRRCVGVAVRVAGAVPLAGVTVSHAASSDAVTSSVPVPVFVTDTVLAAGFVPPCVAREREGRGRHRQRRRRRRGDRQRDRDRLRRAGRACRRA